MLVDKGVKKFLKMKPKNKIAFDEKEKKFQKVFKDMANLVSLKV